MVSVLLIFNLDKLKVTMYSRTTFYPVTCSTDSLHWLRVLKQQSKTDGRQGSQLQRTGKENWTSFVHVISLRSVALLAHEGLVILVFLDPGRSKAIIRETRNAIFLVRWVPSDGCAVARLFCYSYSASRLAGFPDLVGFSFGGVFAQFCGGIHSWSLRDGGRWIRSPQEKVNDIRVSAT